MRKVVGKRSAMAGGRGGGGGGGARGGGVITKKSVRFCAFDLSTIDMPTDAIEDSDTAGGREAYRPAEGVPGPFASENFKKYS